MKGSIPDSSLHFCFYQFLAGFQLIPQNQNILQPFFLGGDILFKYILCLSMISFNKCDFFSIQIEKIIKKSIEASIENPIPKSNIDIPVSFLIFSRFPNFGSKSTFHDQIYILFFNSHFTTYINLFIKYSVFFDYTENPTKDSIPGPNLHFFTFISIAQHFSTLFPEIQHCATNLFFHLLFWIFCWTCVCQLFFLACLYFFDLLFFFALSFCWLLLFFCYLFDNMMLFVHFFGIGFSLDTWYWCWWCGCDGGFCEGAGFCGGGGFLQRWFLRWWFLRCAFLRRWLCGDGLYDGDFCNGGFCVFCRGGFCGVFFLIVVLVVVVLPWLFLWWFFIGGGFCFGVLCGAVFCGGVVCSGGCCGGCFCLVVMVVVIIVAVTAVRIVGVGGCCVYCDCCSMNFLILVIFLLFFIVFFFFKIPPNSQ